MPPSRKGPGRPKKDEEVVRTTHVRIPEDLMDMLREIRLVQKATNGAIIEPMIRPGITKLHADLLPRIRKIQKLQDQPETGTAEE